MVAPRGVGEATWGKLGRNFSGIKEQKATGRETQTVRTRGMNISKFEKSGFWYRDRRRPDGQMTLCGRWKLWDGYMRHLGG